MPCSLHPPTPQLDVADSAANAHCSHARSLAKPGISVNPSAPAHILPHSTHLGAHILSEPALISPQPPPPRASASCSPATQLQSWYTPIKPILVLHMYSLKAFFVDGLSVTGGQRRLFTTLFRYYLPLNPIVWPFVNASSGKQSLLPPANRI